MRQLVIFLSVIALVAGCTNSAATTPGAARVSSPGPTAIPSTAAPGQPAAPNQAPAQSPTAVRAHVTFDGKTCVYSGPTVIPSPATLTIDFAPTPAQEGSSAFIGAIRHGTTQADIDRADAEHLGVDMGHDPAWVDAWTFKNQVGSGSAQYDLKVLRNPDGLTGIYDEYIVSCITSIPGLPAPGSAILQLVETTVPPSPTSAP